MKRKNSLRNCKKQLLVVSLILVLFIAFTEGVFTSLSTVIAYANDSSISFDNQFSGSLDEYSLDEIKSILGANNGQLYQDFRVQSETEGTVTYQVPVDNAELESILGISQNNIQKNDLYSFTRTRI